MCSRTRKHPLPGHLRIAIKWWMTVRLVAEVSTNFPGFDWWCVGRDGYNGLYLLRSISFNGLPFDRTVEWARKCQEGGGIMGDHLGMFTKCWEDNATPCCEALHNPGGIYYARYYMPLRVPFTYETAFCPHWAHWNCSGRAHQGFPYNLRWAARNLSWAKSIQIAILSIAVQSLLYYFIAKLPCLV